MKKVKSKNRTINEKDKRILNCIESTKVEEDWSVETALNSDILTGGPIPTSIDLRKSWWKVGDQKQTGSCVGWATADSVLRWHFVNRQMLNKNELLSTRFIWMASKETDVFDRRPSTFIESAGTSLKAALDIARDFGCVRDNDLPFKSGALFQGSENIFYSLASEYKIRSYYNLNKGGDKLQNWKRWFAGNGGPILTRLDVDDTWYDATKNKGKLKTYKGGGYGGHAIAIVGYIKSQFIVRNSWGKDWGDGGFAYASSAYARKAFTESYGVKIFNQ